MKVQIKVGRIGGPLPKKVATPPKPKPPTRTEVRNATNAQAGHAKLAAEHAKLAAEAKDLGEDEDAATHTRMAATHTEAAAVAGKVLAAVPKKP